MKKTHLLYILIAELLGLNFVCVCVCDRKRVRNREIERDSKNMRKSVREGERGGTKTELSPLTLRLKKYFCFVCKWIIVSYFLV